MGYVDEVLEVVKKKNADQPEFLQAVTEVLDSLRPVIDSGSSPQPRQHHRHQRLHRCDG